MATIIGSQLLSAHDLDEFSTQFSEMPSPTKLYWLAVALSGLHPKNRGVKADALALAGELLGISVPKQKNADLLAACGALIEARWLVDSRYGLIANPRLLVLVLRFLQGVTDHHKFEARLQAVLDFQVDKSPWILAERVLAGAGICFLLAVARRNEILVRDWLQFAERTPLEIDLRELAASALAAGLLTPGIARLVRETVVATWPEKIWKGKAVHERVHSIVQATLAGSPLQAAQEAHALHLLWQGEGETLLKLATGSQGTAPLASLAWAALCNRPDAVRDLELAARHAADGRKAPMARLPEPVRVLYVAAKLRIGTPDALAEAMEAAGPANKGTTVPLSLQVLMSFLQARAGTGPLGSRELLPSPHFDPLYVLATGWVRYAVQDPESRVVTKALESIATERPHLPLWVRTEATVLLARLKGTSRPEDEAKWRGNLGVSWLVCDAMPSVPEWKRGLDALQAALEQAHTPTVSSAKERLVWMLTVSGERVDGAEPRLQANKGGGLWTAGRAVAVKRLLEERAAPPSWLTPADLAVCDAIVRDDSSRWPSYYLDVQKALAKLVGHPDVYWASNPDIRVEVQKGEPEVRATPAKGGTLLSLHPTQPGQALVESASQVRVYADSAAWARLRAAVDTKGLWVPSEGRAQLEALLPSLATLMPVQSGRVSKGAAAGDPRPRLLMSPLGAGLSVAIRVRPLGPDTPAYAPGTGGRTVMATVEGQAQAASRNFDQEIALASAVAEALGLEDANEAASRNWTWTEPSPIGALELLTRAGELSESAAIEWADGRQLASPITVSGMQVKGRIKSGTDWFALDAEIRIDPTTVIRLTELLALYRTAARGRFVEVGTEKILALADDLRRALDELLRFGESTADTVRFRPVAAFAVQPALDTFGELKADKRWRDWKNRLQEALASQPEVPKSVQAVLRPYQEEGFTWMARLASASLGACLADDMGLGKTLQALALLAHRAPEGPALVVAPTSVAPNWLTEALRFTPELRPTLFGQGDRAATISEAGPCDVIITSYGLLLSEAERFKARPWATVVLDEAQNIKNVHTRRAQIAFELDAGFRLATTGTPVENHLGEVWSLFRYLNPGLLGSQERFNERFALPIERDRELAARRHLRALLAPFLLRRTKNQVLTDLPPRTDIVLHVELSPEERHIYEAARRVAIQSLDNSPAKAGARHLQVLSELTRLRRACCHSRFVQPEYAGPSAKGAALLQLVQQLREGGHRALVFSQFVDHLTASRELLESAGISYQYLDGSTPAAQRQVAVKNFQAGQGDVFLISLKAGGTGLNLTAADYVIHLDPWWNPAVEDQASDRAHRIGQTKPVTVYRLVAENTVETKILELHHRKRDLATSLLEGTSDPAKLDLNALLELLH